jgi:hypothetical protein
MSHHGPQKVYSKFSTSRLSHLLLKSRRIIDVSDEWEPCDDRSGRNSCIFCSSDVIHVFITLIDLKTAIYGCAMLYEKKPRFNMVFAVSFISLVLVIFLDNPRAFVSYVAFIPGITSGPCSRGI